jgi:hypothetical protein
VSAGGRYRCHPIGVLEVDSVSRVAVAAIADEDARRAGFADREELVVYLREVKEDVDEVWRIELHHGGDGDRVESALRADVSDQEREEIRGKLARMDDRSERGAWTAKTMRLIERHPRTAASVLAKKLGWPKDELKASIVKLKKLGLTQSFEVGYELSPRGRAYLASRVTRRGR